MLAVASNTSAIAVNLTTPFSASGGVEPYTWSVNPGGAGGTIDPDTGVYTSPGTSGIDEILVTDANAATAEATIAVCTPLELVCDILQNQMGLSAGQVYLYNQKINIPQDSSLYIAVGILSCKPFSNNRSYDGNGSGLTQIQSTNFQATLSVDILSRGPAARDRKEEILLALGSTYAQSQMELNSFYIAPVTSAFANLSEIDGAAIPYRFNISINIQYFVSKTTQVPYFESFTFSTVPNV